MHKNKMAPSMADVSVSLSCFLLFLVTLLFIWNVQCTHAVSYSRETLLNIGKVTLGMGSTQDSGFAHQS